MTLLNANECIPPDKKQNDGMMQFFECPTCDEPLSMVPNNLVVGAGDVMKNQESSMEKDTRQS